jgi:hypothetical protein
MAGSKKKIVVLGFMGNCPIAGVIWQHIHYIVGLQRLGHEVYYIEDTARSPYNPVLQTSTEDADYQKELLGNLAKEFGFVGRWGFTMRYNGSDASLGLNRAEINRLYKEADALLNICGSHAMNDDLLTSENLIYVESDPAVEQIKVDHGVSDTIEFLKHHRALFTFGENIGRDEFPVPLHGFKWMPTRQPVVTDLWKSKSPELPSGSRFTSIANLATGGMKDVEWRGEKYLWSKLPEFQRFRNVPKLAGEDFELAANVKDEQLRSSFVDAGWRFVSPDGMSIDYHAYVDYISNRSKGEFTVAKDQYARLNTGWFSDRSACYLAAGRPVITQQTGFTRMYGGKGGLFAFESEEDVVGAVRAINEDYTFHARAARQIAQESFEAEIVLASLLERAGI